MAASWARSLLICRSTDVGSGGGPGLAWVRGAPTGTFGTPFLGGLGVVVVVGRRRVVVVVLARALVVALRLGGLVVVVGRGLMVVVVGFGAVVVVVVVGFGTVVVVVDVVEVVARAAVRAPATVVVVVVLPAGVLAAQAGATAAMKRATVTPAALAAAAARRRERDIKPQPSAMQSGAPRLPRRPKASSAREEATCGEERPPPDGRMSSGAAAGRVRPVRGLSCATGRRPERPGRATDCRSGGGRR